jgi:FecR-like protein
LTAGLILVEHVPWRRCQRRATRMKNTIVLVVLVLGALSRGAWAQDDPPAPKDGQFYPVGTTLKAVCIPSGASYTESTWTNFQWWDEKRGDWNSNTPSVPQNKAKCFARFNTPGKYRMMVVHGRWDRDERHEIVAEFTIGQPTPCEGKSNQIVSVRDAHGRTLDDEARKAMGLGGSRFATGQSVVVPKDLPQGIEIEFYDYSIMRIASGSKLQINKCSDLDPIADPLKVRISLLLGEIWSKITPNSADWNIQTERAVCGNRGTTFSVKFDPGTATTTVVVEEGSMWLRNRFGKPTTIIINKSETGTQSHDSAPTLKKY